MAIAEATRRSPDVATLRRRVQQIVAIGIAPALLMGAAIALRPISSMSWPTGTSMIRPGDRLA